MTFGAPFADPDTTFDSGSGYSIGTTNIESGATGSRSTFCAASTHNLNQSGGNLGGSGLLTVGSGTTTWTDGTMSGSGITQCLGGTLYLGASGVAGDSETLAGRTFINDGSGVWYGSDMLTQEGTSTFLNDSNATLVIENGGTWGYGIGASDPSGTFDNNGTVTVADGSASTLVQTYLVNSGTIAVASGTLELDAGGACPWSALAVKAGFTVDSGASLLIGNNGNAKAYAFTSGAYVGGAGSVTFGQDVSANFATGSTYNPSGETLIQTTGAAGARVVFTRGRTGGPRGHVTLESRVVNFSTAATVTAAAGPEPAQRQRRHADRIKWTRSTGDSDTWTDGTMSGPGATVAEGGLDLGQNDPHSHSQTLEARTLINQGTAIWVGSGSFNLSAGSTFTNEVNATFDDQADGGLDSDGGGLFDNQGTFVVDVASTVTASMQSNFNNEFQVQISSGTWQLSSDGKSSGTFTLGAGAALQLNTNYGIKPAQIIGENSTNVTLIGGPALPAPLDATTEIEEGSYEESGSDTIGSLDFTGGDLLVTGALIVAGPLTMSGGGHLVIAGTGTLTVTGPMTWTGGYIAGPGTLVVDGNLTLGTGSSGEEALSGTTLENQSIIYVLDGDVFSQQVSLPSTTRSITISTLKATQPGTATAPQPLTTPARSRRRPERARPRSRTVSPWSTTASSR